MDDISHPDRRPNMFSFQSSQQHGLRRRIYAKRYSKSSISRADVQNLIRNRVSKVLEFLTFESDKDSNCTTAPLNVTNMFRALQVDISTAFVFSEADGTDFLAKLGTSDNMSLSDLGMEPLDLFHEEMRGKFFYWESEEPFKSFGHFIAPHAQEVHRKAENWIADIISRFEYRYGLYTLAEQRSVMENCVYGSMLLWRDPHSMEYLKWDERASEIQDHVGKSK